CGQPIPGEGTKIQSEIVRPVGGASEAERPRHRDLSGGVSGGVGLHQADTASSRQRGGGGRHRAQQVPGRSLSRDTDAVAADDAAATAAPTNATPTTASGHPWSAATADD